MAVDSPYLKPGRLADVLAALQIMAVGQRPEGKISWWADELSRGLAKGQIERWTDVFQEHPEFFLLYTLANDPTPKAALRWRYPNKRYDHKTGKEYTQQEKEALPKQQQELLTTKPLDGEAVSVLLEDGDRTPQQSHRGTKFEQVVGGPGVWFLAGRSLWSHPHSRRCIFGAPQ